MWIFWMARTAHIRAISPAVVAANHSVSVAMVVAMTDTITAFMVLVTNAGLSGPVSVGTIEGINASWQKAKTVSCSTAQSPLAPAACLRVVPASTVRKR